MSKKHRHKKKQPHINTKRIEKKAANPPREKTRKEVVVWEATGIRWIFLVLFFLLGIGSIAVLTYILPYAAMHDMDDKWKEYRNKKSVALADAEFPGKTFANVTTRMDRIPEKTKVVCRILLLYKDSPVQADIDWLRDKAAMQIAMDVLPSREECSVVPVLVNGTTGEGEYISKTFGISAYVHGCRLLKRYLK